MRASLSFFLPPSFFLGRGRELLRLYPENCFWRFAVEKAIIISQFG